MLDQGTVSELMSRHDCPSLEAVFEKAEAETPELAAVED